MPKIPYSLTFFTLGMLLAGVELSGKFTISDILKEEKIVYITFSTCLVFSVFFLHLDFLYCFKGFLLKKKNGNCFLHVNHWGV